MHITFLSLETLESGQMESYFTNLDFPERSGPISLPKRYLLEGPKTGRVFGRLKFDQLECLSKLFEQKKSHQEWRFPCEKISASLHTEEFTRFLGSMRGTKHQGKSAPGVHSKISG